MKNKRLSLINICFFLPLLPAIYLFGQCLYVISSRIFYPYELEWIEGGILQSVVRILDGLPLYAAPSMDYVPSLYAPLYFYVSALATTLFGVGLPALRLTSFFFALLSAVFVSSAVWQLSRSRLAMLLTLFSWGAMYRFSGGWYEVARVDSLWSFFIIAAVTALVFFRKKGWEYCLWLAMFCLCLAVFTKQATLMLLPFFILAVWSWAGFSLAVRFGLVLALLIGVLAAYMQWLTDGWFYFYTMEMGREHNFNPGIPMNFLHGDIFLSMPVFVLLSSGFALLCQSSRRDVFAWVSLFSGFMIMSLLSRWYSGGYFNVLIPLHQLFLIMGISGFAICMAKMNAVATGVWRYAVMLLLSLLLMLNIAIGWFNPSSQIPTAADRHCGDAIVKRLSAVQGQVCISKHGYLAYLAGKSFCAHEAFAVDLFNGSNAVLAKQLVDETYQRIDTGYYQVLLLDNQAQFAGYGANFDTLRYTATNLDCPADSFYPLIRGQRPLHWLEYNGSGMVDLREPEAK